MPGEVRVTSSVHPLFGRLLTASGFRRVDGVVFLVVGLPDGSPGTIPAAATNVFGEQRVDVDEADGTVLSVEGLRALRALVRAALPAPGQRPPAGGARS